MLLYELAEVFHDTNWDENTRSLLKHSNMYVELSTTRRVLNIKAIYEWMRCNPADDPVNRHIGYLLFCKYSFDLLFEVL